MVPSRGAECKTVRRGGADSSADVSALRILTMTGLKLRVPDRLGPGTVRVGEEECVGDEENSAMHDTVNKNYFGKVTAFVCATALDVMSLQRSFPFCVFRRTSTSHFFSTMRIDTVTDKGHTHSIVSVLEGS